MKIEILEDVLNDIADKSGVYGACKSENFERCDNTSPFCCRVGFMMHYKVRIRQAIANEEKLKESGF